MPNDIKIRYIKSYDYKVVLATGVYGGVMTNGLISVNFFTDRVIIPDSETLAVDDKGVPTGERYEAKDGELAREVQTGLLIDVNTAQIIINWLQDKIKDFNKLVPKK